MNTKENWLVELSAEEIDGHTRALARLQLTDYETVSGLGLAAVSPSDREATLIGEQVAIARALSDLAGKLLDEAGESVEPITLESVLSYM